MHKMLLTSALLIPGVAMADFGWQINIAAGSAALNAGSTVLDVTEYEQDKAIQTNSDDWKSWTVQVGLGYVFPLLDNETWLTAIEPQINFYYLKGNIEGYVDRYYQYDIDCEDAAYQMELNSRRVMLDVAVNVFTFEDFSLYGIAGIGPSWNSIHYYQDESEHYLPIDLGAHTDANFAYEFGGGISYQLIEDVAFTAEYLYTGFSDVSLNQSSGIETDDFSLNSQAILLGFNLAL